MIKFITEENTPAQLEFRDIKENQFFVNFYGNLCQKVSSNQYNTIADKNGVPFGCASIHIDEDRRDMFVQRILPKITRIEF
jgi:hypothetical protein